MRGLHAKVRRIELLAAQTTDDGTLAAWVLGVQGRIKSAFSQHWLSTLRRILSQHATYVVDRSFLVADGPEFNYPLPHVEWKAHLGAQLGTAFTVLYAALPVLKGLGVQHKVDTNPAVFEGTNKFLTIYPPRDPGQWPDLIKRLDAVPGTVQVVGELPVGPTGAVGMRHGQISALSEQVLAEHQLSLKPEGTKIRGHDCWTIVDDKTKTPLKLVPTSWAAGRQTFLTLHEGTVFVGKLTTPATINVAPAILHEGVVKPDPRSEPNPFNVALPKGVTEFQ